MARPRSLDESKQREICALVSAGCSLATAARYVGCSPITIRREASRNVAFYDRLRQAELGSQVSPLQAMRRTADKHWRAAAWLLERIDPDRFERRKPDYFSHDDITSFVQDVSNLLDEHIVDPEMAERVTQDIERKYRDFRRQKLAALEPLRDPRSRRPRSQPVPPVLPPLHDPLGPTERTEPTVLTEFNKTSADSEPHEPQ